MTTTRVLFFVLSATVVLKSALSSNCPPPEDTWPCSCHEQGEETKIILYCTDKGMDLRQLKTALNALKGTSSIGVELQEITLGRVPFDFFRGYDIKYLHISLCKLDTLSDGPGKPLTGLEDSLEELTISSSFTEDNVPAELVIRHLHNLRELVLTFNFITNLSNDWFKDAPLSLRRLSINNNEILQLGTRAFADIYNLEFLSLEGNRFGALERNILPNPANELDTLILDNNALRSLPDDFFLNMPYLKQVFLSSNAINQLPERVWKTVWSRLDDIDLSDNPLVCDSHMDWMLKVPTCADISATCIAPRQKFRKTVPFMRCAFYLK